MRRLRSASRGVSASQRSIGPQLPPWRPGCGSLSVDPRFADRLRAEAENSPLRARKIEIAPPDDEFEFMFDQGFTDGLPVVPPTPERVIRMLSGTRRDPQQLVAIVPPNMGEATVEKIAINAVLAGCRPEYLPVVIAALEAVCTDAFNMHGVMATTMGASPVLVVNGPIRQRIGMNMKIGALGQGNRANASIGRALRLAHPQHRRRETRRHGTFDAGQSDEDSRCVSRNGKSAAHWPPLHVERGFAPTDSVVTAYAMTSGPVADRRSDVAQRRAARRQHRHGSWNRSIIRRRTCCSMHCWWCVRNTSIRCATGGYSKADLRRRIQKITGSPLT